MKKITKEHRVLDDTDLNNINNTFEKIDVTFKSIEKTCDSIKWVLGFLVAVITTVFVSGLIALLIKLFF